MLEMSMWKYTSSFQLEELFQAVPLPGLIFELLLGGRVLLWTMDYNMSLYLDQRAHAYLVNLASWRSSVSTSLCILVPTPVASVKLRVPKRKDNVQMNHSILNTFKIFNYNFLHANSTFQDCGFVIFFLLCIFLVFPWKTFLLRYQIYFVFILLCNF